MRTSLAIPAAVLLAATIARAEPALGTERERLSYALGADLGRRIRTLSLDVDPALVGKGFGDALSRAGSLLSDDEVSAALNALQVELKTRQAAMLAARTGEAFRRANAAKEGVVTLPSGLQYKILKAGTGQKPGATDVVECHYRGLLVDGTEFDSSHRRGKPAAVKMSGDAIAGWREALKLMSVGSRWQLVVPPELAYGERGSGAVGPNATLIFEIELLAIGEVAP